MLNPIKFAVAFAVTVLVAFSTVAQTKKPAPAAAPTPVPAAPSTPSDRERDGLNGPVRKIKTEVAKLTTKAGTPIEGARVTLESAAYDVQGAKVDTAYYPVAGNNLTGRETYKYDDQGNISEMTMFNPDGSLLAKEVYKYEYDFVGNWTTMTTSVAVIEGGKMTYDPTEVTHRTISYYLDEKLTKMMEASQKPPAPVSPTNTTAGQPNQTAGNVQPKPSGTPSGATNDPTGGNVAANHVVENRIPDPKPADPSATTGSAPTVSNSAGKSADPIVVKPSADDKSNTAANTASGEPAKPAPKPITKPVSGGVLNGSAMSLPAPSYPEIAKRSRASGTVVVEVVIDEDGKVISAKAVNGPSLLFGAAVEAAKRARFSPTKLSGQPVKVTGIINYNFSLGI
jgi:protein TonB